MLQDFLFTGIQLTQIIGLLLILWGVFTVIVGIASNRGVMPLAQGAAMMIFGAYVAGLGQIL
jgi:hypothetical protein